MIVIRIFLNDNIFNFLSDISIKAIFLILLLINNLLFFYNKTTIILIILKKDRLWKILNCLHLL